MCNNLAGSIESGVRGEMTETSTLDEVEASSLLASGEDEAMCYLCHETGADESEQPCVPRHRCRICPSLMSCGICSRPKEADE